MKFLSILLFFVTLIVTIYGYTTDLTLDDAKKYKVNKCKSDNDCSKNYEIKCNIEKGKKEGYCISKLYCQNNDEKCVFEVKTEKNFVSYQSVNSDSYSLFRNEKPSLILEACNEKEEDKGKCYTRECDSNSNCYSNYCKNKICITDKVNSTSVCTNDPTAFIGIGKKFDRSKFTCKLVEQEPCKKDKDCATGKCQKGDGGDKICVIPESTSSGGGLFKLIMEILLLALVAGLIFMAIKFIRSKTGTTKDLKVKYEMEETFLKQSNKSYVELEDIEDYDINDFERKVNKNL